MIGNIKVIKFAEPSDGADRLKACRSSFPLAIMEYKPINPINKWSCFLACIEWYLQTCDHPSQQEIIDKFKDYFPKWHTEPGTCSRGDIINLIQFLGIKHRKFIHTNVYNEIENGLQVLNNKMTFVLTRKPKNHCMVVVSRDSDNFLLTMNPIFPNAEYKRYQLNELLIDYDSDFLFVYFL